MNIVRVCLFAFALAFAAGAGQDVKFPSGKSQRDEILKMEYEKSVREAAELVKLSRELQTDLEKGDWRVLRLESVKKAEQIEKLAHQIKTRLKK